MERFKTKLILLVLLIICLGVITFYGVFGLSISPFSTNKIKSTRKEQENLTTITAINGTNIAYDKNTNTYFYTISKRSIGSTVALKLEFDGNYKYKFKGHAINLVKVDFNRTYKVTIYNKNKYYETKIRFTNLPIVNIGVNSDITRDETNSDFTYINSTLLNKVVNNNSTIKIRGQSSSVFPKKSYKIKMYNKSYSKDKDIIMSKFYYGSSFILDALYRDSSKVRNLLATQLWNVVSNDFTNIDIYSEFVEVFINNEYKGLYLLTEPINRTKLGLTKSKGNNTSVIIKSSGWQTHYSKDLNDLNLNSDVILDYELKYPNDEELYYKSWETFLDITKDYYDAEKENSYEIISNTWNIKNYIDMVIFNAFINNVDNVLLKNNYFYMKDINSHQLYIQPWDMEYSFGLTYYSNDNLETSTLNYNNILKAKKKNDYKSTILLNLDSYPNKMKKLIVKRYFELRKNGLNSEYLNKLLDKYSDELNLGSALRDSEIWLEYDINDEFKFIKNWIKNRLEFMDKYMKGIKYE